MRFSPILQIKPLPYLEKIVDFGCGLRKIFGKHRGVMGAVHGFFIYCYF